jgi:hypothetical protein
VCQRHDLVCFAAISLGPSFPLEVFHISFPRKMMSSMSFSTTQGSVALTPASANPAAAAPTNSASTVDNHRPQHHRCGFDACLVDRCLLAISQPKTEKTGCGKRWPTDRDEPTASCSGSRRHCGCSTAVSLPALFRLHNFVSLID